MSSYKYFVYIKQGRTATAATGQLNSTGSSIDSFAINAGLSPVSSGFDGPVDVWELTLSNPAISTPTATAEAAITTSDGSAYSVNATNVTPNTLGATSGSSAQASNVPMVNNAPTANVSPLSISAPEGSIALFDASAQFTDADGDNMTFSISGADAAKFAVDGGDNVTVGFANPGDSVVGSYSFDVTADDGNGGTAVMTVNLAVTSVKPITWAEHDFEASGSALTINTAALIAQSGSANTELHAVGVHNIQHVDGITLTHGNNTITLFEDNSTMRTGSNLDNDTYASVSDFTLTVPAGGAVRIYWAEITA